MANVPSAVWQVRAEMEFKPRAFAAKNLYHAGVLLTDGRSRPFRLTDAFAQRQRGTSDPTTFKETAK